MDTAPLHSQYIAGVFAVGERRSGNLEDPAVSLTDPDAWAAVFGGELATHAGEKVSHKKALSIAAIWQAVSVISGDIAKLPFDCFRRRPELSEDARVPEREHAAARLCRVQPNRESNAVKFWRRVMVHALIWNNAYIYIDRDATGKPLELLHLLPDRTSPERKNGEFFYVTEVRGRKDNGRMGKARLVSVPAADVIHIEGLSINCLEGHDLLAAARNSFALALAKEKFASKFFANGGRIGGILELPAGMQKPAQDNVVEGFRQMYEGSDNPFKTVILRDSAKFHAGQISPEDAQLVEATEADVRQVARWFNLAPSRLGLSDSVSYGSKAEDNQSYLDSTLAIWLALIAAECNCKLLTPEEQAVLFFEHNTAALLKMNLLQRYQAYEVGIRTRLICPNEARAKENMPPYKGGEIFVNPNISPAAPLAQEPPAKKRDLFASRALFEVTARAREKAKNAKAFLQWVDGGLAPHRQSHPGVAPEEFDKWLAAFRDVADRTSESALLATVNRVALEMEQE